MKNPLLTIVMIACTLVHPPLVVLFAPVLLGRIMHYFRVRRVYGRR